MTGGEEEAGMTGNSHMHAPVDGNAKSHENENHTSGGQTTEKEPTSKAKEKSVLQAKLTKLAIQIGYAGMLLVNFIILSFSRLLYCRLYPAFI